MSRLGRGFPNNALLRPIPVVPVSYDATGTGATTGVATTVSWSHTATAGAYVLAAFVSTTDGTTLSNVKYGTASMALVGSQNMGGTSGPLCIYGLANAPAGAQTISATASASTVMNGCSVSYLHVSALGTSAVTSGSSASPSQSATRPFNGIAVQAFGCYNASVTSYSGGTPRYNAISGTGFAALAIQDSAANNPSFGAVLSGSTPWAGVAVPLFPI